MSFRYMAVAEQGRTALMPDDVTVFKESSFLPLRLCLAEVGKLLMLGSSQVPFGAFIKLNPGTWHAGPHFDNHEYMDFYNLELSDTNQVDHNNFHFDDECGIEIRILPC